LQIEHASQADATDAWERRTALRFEPFGKRWVSQAGSNVPHGLKTRATGQPPHPSIPPFTEGMLHFCFGCIQTQGYHRGQ
jgi:hypothetical protein